MFRIALPIAFAAFAVFCYQRLANVGALKQEGGTGEMFDDIAGQYDLLNRILSLGTDNGWRAALVEAAGPGDVIDLATGTGDVAIRLHETFPERRVVGVDPSREMLAVARQKAPEIEFVLGSGESLEFEDDAFHSATIAFGIRNVRDRVKTIQEMQRVVKKGGKVLILELGMPSDGIGGMFGGLHVKYVVPFLGKLITQSPAYDYLADSISLFPRRESFVTTLQDAGLVDVTVRSFMFGAANLFVGTKP